LFIVLLPFLTATFRVVALKVAKDMPSLSSLFATKLLVFQIWPGKELKQNIH